MLLKKAQTLLEELFEWLGDINLGERSHMVALVPVNNQHRTPSNSLHQGRNRYYPPEH